MKHLRKIIEINEERCDGCGQCLPNCAEGSLALVDGKAKLVAENLCDGLGACLGVCPTGALRIIERQADAFDEEAVEDYLQNRRDNPSTACQAANIPTMLAAGDSAGAGNWRNWPVKLHLLPPSAPFLRGADLLIAADCCPVACRDFHSRYFDGRVVMIGCPKFDDKEAHRDRLAEIFRGSHPQSITLLIMDVPCCSAFAGIVRQAAQTAGCILPVNVVTMSRQGEEIAAAG
jgi:NAD-dependent dihydropyrimidine dehydrogenase PreA subunit